MDHAAKLVGVGWILQDTVMLLPKYPAEDLKTQAIRTLEQVGGPVARALSVAAHLGVSSSLGAVLGPDAAGSGCLESLRSRGCDVDNVAISATGASRRSHVWVSAKNGSRTIAYSEDPHLRPLTSTPGLRTAVRSARAVHFDGRELEAALQLAELARGSGATVVIDAGGWKPGLDRLVALSDYLVVSKAVLLERESGDPLVAAGRLLEACGSLSAVILTSGAEGTTIVERTRQRHVPIVKVEVVDTNGAGDAFCGGFLAGLVLGRNLIEAVRLGSGAAASACSRFGDYFPDLDEVDALLSSHPITGDDP